MNYNGALPIFVFIVLGILAMALLNSSIGK